jgi:hypothetical protein
MFMEYPVPLPRWSYDPANPAKLLLDGFGERKWRDLSVCTPCHE